MYTGRAVFISAALVMNVRSLTGGLNNCVRLFVQNIISLIISSCKLDQGELKRRWMKRRGGNESNKCMEIARKGNEAKRVWREGGGKRTGGGCGDCCHRCWDLQTQIMVAGRLINHLYCWFNCRLNSPHAFTLIVKPSRSCSISLPCNFHQQNWGNSICTV